jgi:hypothetical protein
MEAYVRLPGGQASQFYLARIDSVYAGRTVEIELWDPGDTGRLSAQLEILQPTSTGYQPISFNWSSAVGTSANSASNCGGRSANGVSSVTTNTGGNSQFNGCWLTIEVTLPNSYTAPHPSSDSVTSEGGWWKIRYTMGGDDDDYSTDLTVWKVSIRGSPVHLVR